MTRNALFSISLAAILASTGCAVRMSAVPAATTSAGEPREEASENPRPRTEAAVPVRAPQGSADAPADSSSGAPPPAAMTPPSADRRAAEDRAPAATASAYVFSSQQAASVPRSSSPTSGTAPAVSLSEAAPEADAEASPASERAPGELQLLVVASASEIAAGGITIVDVIASSSTAVVDAPLRLTFDPAVMEFVDGATGDFLTQGGSSVVFLADGRSRPGDVAIAAGRIEREHGARGAGLLCRVRLRGIGPGTTSVLVGEARAWGTQGQELAVLKGGTTVAVN